MHIIEDSLLAEKLLQILEREGGFSHLKITQLKSLTEGAGANTWLLSTDDTTHITEKKYIARIAHSGELFAQAISKTQEAKIQKLAFTQGVPVADVIAVLQPEDGLGEGYIMPCVIGETRPNKILRADDFTNARSSIIDQCAKALSSIHQIDIAELTTNNILTTRSTQQQLNDLQLEFSKYEETLPVFELAFRYLKQHCPTQEELCVVHGDFRNGNLMVDKTGLVAVLDWELAHIGNPLEDLGWLCVTSWRFSKPDKPVGGFGSYQQLLDAYAKYSGREVALQELLYWELLGVLRWGVLCLYQTHVHLSGAEVSVEKALIGRRVSECEIDMLELMQTLSK